MKIFVRVVSVAAVVVAVLAFRSAAPVRASLLAVLAIALWVASSRPVKHPQLLVVGAVATLVGLIGTLVGPYRLVIFDSIDAAP